MSAKQIQHASGVPIRETEGTRWWLISGVGLGVLNVVASVAFGFKLGITTAFSAIYKHLLEAAAPVRAVSNPYLATLPVAGDWEMFLLVGLVIGAYIAYRTGPTPKGLHVPGGELLRSIGARRFALVFLGTFLLGYGARLAGGCTTGHILSGWPQLATGSLVFGFVAMPTAILTARVLYARLGGP